MLQQYLHCYERVFYVAYSQRLLYLATRYRPRQASISLKLKARQSNVYRIRYGSDREKNTRWHKKIGSYTSDKTVAT